MKAKGLINRILSVVLVLSILFSASPLAFAANDGRQSLSFEKVDGASADTRLTTPSIEAMEEAVYADTDSVRVSIVLEDAPTLELYSSADVAENASAMAYREELKAAQDDVSAEIEEQILDGEELNVVWNMTLAANIISANVEYGQIEDIEALDGIAEVVIEKSYNPLSAPGSSADTFMATSSGMIGAGSAWSSGYTGAGTRIAIIDTGIDTDHQSFDVDAFLYSLEQQAAKKDMDVDAYVESLDLLTAADIADVFDELNIYPYVQYLEDSANGAYYINEKIPFALSYVDRNYAVTHDDGISEHGSHVAGIAAANSYIPDGNGGYTNAVETVLTQGVAPDAQIIVMKVFSTANGGAYDSDYMVAIEDAIMLGCDVVNLSLGSDKDFARSQLYQDILDSLEDSNTVVTIAAGNSGDWAANSSSGYLYADDIDLSMLSSPAAATNSLAVASVENVGTTDYYISVDGSIIYYDLGIIGNSYTDGLNVLAGGDYDYIYIDGLGTAEDLAALPDEDWSRTILVCSRGEINFSEKANNASEAGFAGLIVYNNVDGIFSMNLEGYTGTIPCVSITMADSAILKAAATPVTDGEDNVLYREGTMYVSDQVKSTILNSNDFNMSDFSSWGVAGSLELKPEISAPGGEIYSVNGSVSSGDAYELMSGTSMAAPQVAGMAAVVMQYIRENGLEAKTGLTARQLATSLLMSTATPLTDDGNGGNYYPVLQQGAGLANLGNALQASSYIKMEDGATSGAADGKVKVELGDDPDRTGIYTFAFTINNFSDTPKTYNLSSDFFTQDTFEYEGTSYLDTYTTPLAANVTYVVDSQSLTVSSAFECDLNADYVTDAQDAQIILEYSVGNDVAQYLTAINAKADLNDDGDVNTYDAHLLLASLQSGYFQVEAGDSVYVQVVVQLTDKAYLDENYVNGAYVQGFVYANSAPSVEGEVDPDHSIPVLGFYGNWSDAAMYERADYEDYTYYANGSESDFLYPYSGGLNYLSLFDEDNNESYFVGNPYLVEDEYPAGKEAISSKTELGDFVVTLIRNAGGFMFYVKDETTGEIVHADSSEQLNAAYYYASYQSWVWVNSVGLSIWETPKHYGFEEDDVFTIGFMSVPEYYETNGALSTEDMLALMKSGEIGEGAYHTRTFTVDDTAPEILGVEKDAETGDLIIKAKDNQYIAAVAVLNAKGSNVLAMTGVEQDKANTRVETVVDMEEISEFIDSDCLVMVADYAGNESYYKVVGYNDGVGSYAGRMYAFTNTAARGTINSWMEIDVDDLYFVAGDNGNKIGGTYDVANMNWAVKAAEFVNGYVFMITDTNQLYVAEQGDWENCFLVGSGKSYANIKDMAYDYTTNTLYALGGNAAKNTIYSVDIITGALTEEYTVSLSFPKSIDASVNNELLTLAIDDEGNFYSVNSGDTNYQRVYLFKWNKDNVVGGKVSNLTPVNNTEKGYAGDYVYSDSINYNGIPCTQSMAWDHDNDILYWANAATNVSPWNTLYTFNTETGKVTKAVESISGVKEAYVSVLSGNISGLYIVPASAGTADAAENATGIQLSNTALTLLEGAEYELSVDVFPWNLEDKSVTWSSDDESVATVDKDGLITAVKAGTATITATTKASPNLTATCEVTVVELQSVNLSALLYDGQSKVNLTTFDITAPEGWTVIEGGDDLGYNFLAGGLVDDTLYFHDGDHMYGVDANTFEVTDYGYLDPTWQWSDAAPAPANSTDYFDRLVGIINSGCALGVMDVEEGIASEITHYSLFGKDPMALIAYKGACTYTDEYGSYDAHEYYVLTESGKLYSIIVFAFYDGDAMTVFYSDSVTYVGDTGLRLTGVSDVTSGRSGSMHYDGANDYLIVSTYVSGNYNKLYVFDPDVCAPVEVGNFGSEIWPVVSLYQYTQLTELTVKVEPEKAALYVGETVRLESTVYKYTESDEVYWGSSDETIATVDENGIVTAHKAGTVTITAYSAEDESVSDSAVITVKPLTSLNMGFHAYITTEDGGKWVSIKGSDLSYEVLGTSDAQYTGAAVSDGKVYATDSTNYYEIDPSNDYAIAKGDNYTDANGASFMYMLDGTSVPRDTIEIPDASTGEMTDLEVGGIPVYISGYDGNGYHYLTMLEDYKTGKISAAEISYTYNPAAIAYHSSEIIEEVYYFDFYYVLGYDGLLETYSLYTAVIDGVPAVAGGWENDTIDTGLEFEDGDDVSMIYVDTNAFTGIIVSHATRQGTDFYCYDLDNMRLGKMGSIADATDLVGLSLLSDVGLESGETQEYKKQVTFKVVNGTWSDGSTDDIVVTVDLKDGEGNWSETGTGALTVPTGMIANQDYEGGAWDVEPPATVSGTEAVTYTYTFTAKPAEPSDSNSLLGYLAVEDGYVWAEIDPADGSYTVLADGTLAYNGAGHSNGKMYATYAVSQWGGKDYYMIDPANGYTDTKGYTGYGVYHMYDGAGAPLRTVELYDEAAEDMVEVEVGGYMAYISWQWSSYYLFMLNDYTSQTGYTQFSVSPSLPAKPMGIAYRGTEVSGDDLVCTETFVILCSNGALVEVSVKTSLSDGVKTVSEDVTTKTLATLEIEGLSSATNVSMTRTGKDVYAISMATGDGVVLYSYDLANETLTELSTVDAISLVGLTLMTDLTGQTPEEEGGEAPAEKDDSLLAYVNTADGYQWVKIDPAELSYEKLADGTLAYNGAGHSNGKMYATYAVSQWGGKDYYMIDPANGYTDTKGYTGYGVYHMYDGAGAPLRTVELFDETAEDMVEVEVGGYMAYISWQWSSYYVFMLNDYTSQTGYTQFSVSPSLPAKPMGIAYRGTEVSGDDLVCTEKFVVLCSNGALVEVSVKTSVSDGVKTVSQDVSTKTLTTLEVEGLSSATNVSMTRTGNDVYAISVATGDGVALYSYDLGAETLTGLGAMEDFTSLVGLTLMTDLTGQTPETDSGSQQPTPDPVAEYKQVTFKVVNGTWANGSSEDIVVDVELTDGSGTLTAPTGMIANDGYEGGAWDVTPPATVTGTEAVTYTYTFTAKSEEDPQVPAPAVEDMSMALDLHAYLSVADYGNAWAAISTGDMSYEAQTDYGYAIYTGAGVYDGKIYAGDDLGYYQIAPASNYGMSDGGMVDVGMAPLDVTGVPSSRVEIYDFIYEEEITVRVGGYPAYVTADSLVILHDYVDVYTMSYSVEGISMRAVAHLDSTVDGEFYYENYLVLSSDGKLYKLTLTGMCEEEILSLSSFTSLTLVADLSAMSLSGDKQSMTLINDGTNYGIVISDAREDGVVLFYYDLSAGKLGKLGAMEDAYGLIGLSTAAEVGISTETDPEPSPDPEPDASKPELGQATLTLNLHAYVKDSSYQSAWTSINTGDMSYEAVSEYSWSAYTGAGLYDGKIYAGDELGYYQIDPANDYGMSDGGTVSSGMAPLDVTGVPSSRVEIYDFIYEEEITVKVGGYPAYVTADSLVILHDYIDSYTVSYSTEGISMRAVAYLDSTVDGEFYYESYLVLSSDGKLYKLTLTGMCEEEVLSLSSFTSLTLVADLSNMNLSGNKQSMTLINDGINYGLVIADSASSGVALYYYDLNAGTLGAFGTLKNTIELVGLSLMSEAGAAAAASFRNGGSLMSLPVTGAAAASVVLTRENVTVDADKNTVTLNLVEDVAVTNGLVEVTYDPSVLTYAGASGINAYYAVNSSESGKVMVGYAAAEAIAAGDAIAALKFTYTAETTAASTDVTVTTLERSDAVDVSESGETITITLSGSGSETPDVPVLPPVSPVIPPETADPSVPGSTQCDGTGNCESLAYGDLNPNAWYHEYTDYVIGNGLMTGIGNGKFDPNATVTRATIWTVLARQAKQDLTGSSPWYARAQAWAMDTGVSDGTNPGTTVTREQLVTMLYRFVGSPAVSAADKALLNSYPDAHLVSDWAEDGMAWAIANGIINGIDGKLVPQGSASRIELATILTRFCRM